ncbi:MAG TPA: hypothetical protein ENK06_04235 [Gammaproteobacteria bacterium]|nr:hypothetical protein [Gammaproteobacteria bacterium]
MPHDFCSVSNLTIHAGDRLLLSGIDLKIAKTGFYAIMGPVGVGKSTLLAVLNGRGNENGLSVCYACTTYAGSEISPDNHPIVIEQANRSEQARRAIDGGTIKTQIEEALADDPSMLCLDEPTSGVAHNEALTMLNWLKSESLKRAIVMVTHNSEQARFYADWVVLLGGGRVVEQGPTGAFFDKPSNPETKHFIKTGSLSLPRLDAHPRQLAPEHRGLPEGINAKTVGSADGILSWIIRRSFAIATVDVNSDANWAILIKTLKNRSIDMLVVCERILPEALDDLKVAGIDVILYPCTNPDTPKGIQASLARANQIDEVISVGRRVAVLETGTGQTGIIAAVQLIHMGITANDAIDLLNAKTTGTCIQLHDEQFLWDLEMVLDLNSDKDQSAIYASSMVLNEEEQDNPVGIAGRLGPVI